MGVLPQASRVSSASTSVLSMKKSSSPSSRLMSESSVQPSTAFSQPAARSSAGDLHENLHVGPLALFDLVVDDVHQLGLAGQGRNGKIDALGPAHALVGCSCPRCRWWQECPAGCSPALGVLHGQPHHVQDGHRQTAGQPVVKIMGGVAGDGQNGGPVFHQHLRVPLHLGEGIVLAFAQNVGGAIRSGSPAGDHDGSR